MHVVQNPIRLAFNGSRLRLQVAVWSRKRNAFAEELRIVSLSIGKLIRSDKLFDRQAQCGLRRLGRRGDREHSPTHGTQSLPQRRRRDGPVVGFGNPGEVEADHFARFQANDRRTGVASQRRAIVIEDQLPRLRHGNSPGRQSLDAIDLLEIFVQRGRVVAARRVARVPDRDDILIPPRRVRRKHQRLGQLVISGNANQREVGSIFLVRLHVQDLHDLDEQFGVALILAKKINVRLVRQAARSATKNKLPAANASERVGHVTIRDHDVFVQHPCRAHVITREAQHVQPGDRLDHRLQLLPPRFQEVTYLFQVGRQIVIVLDQQRGSPGQQDNRLQGIQGGPVRRPRFDGLV